MKTPLEDFVRQNRDQFDHRTPNDRVWRGIEGALTGRAKWWNSLSVWRAAAILMMGLSVYLWFFKPGLAPKPGELARVQGEFRDAETFYEAQIAEKVAMIENFENGYEDDDFTQDLQKLDAMYQVLMEEMRQKPSEKVKDALVLNMLVRIDLLNQQIKKLEDSRKPKEDVSI